MSAVLDVVRSASFLTSSATTAKPRPCSPARAASMAAFSASRLVWSAISLIDLSDVADLGDGLVQVGDGAAGGLHGFHHPLGGRHACSMLAWLTATCAWALSAASAVRPALEATSFTDWLKLLGGGSDGADAIPLLFRLVDDHRHFVFQAPAIAVRWHLPPN